MTTFAAIQALEQQEQALVFAYWPDGALGTRDYAAHGGGFPVRVKGAGVVASIAVSGLPSHEDHDLIVAILAQLLGVAAVPAIPIPAPSL